MASKTQSPEAKVARGAKFLDKKSQDWHKKVKRSKLKMDTNDLCVLGQIGDGDADVAMEDLGIDVSEAERYGFVVMNDDAKELGDLWKTAIKERLA